MKKVLQALMFCSVLLLSSCSSSNETTEPTTPVVNELEGTAKGYLGDITLNVKVQDKVIQEITVIEQNETPTIGGVAIDIVAKEIVKNNSIEVDSVTGATVSSKAVIEAVTVALKKGDIDASTLVPNENTNINKENVTETHQVVVVGAGGAGMTAAIELKEKGFDVIVLEKMPFVGGNTSRASGGINAVGSELQKESGINTTVEQFVKETIEGGYGLNNEDLVTVMAENSADAIKFLESLGLNFEKVSFSGGFTDPAIHSLEGGKPIGDTLVKTLSSKLEELNVPVLLSTTATSLIKDENGNIVGVKAESKDKNYTFNSDSVLLATGGFGANPELVVEYRPDLDGFITTNQSGATGDGIEMALEVGASLTDIDQIQIHPTVEQSKQTLVTEALRGDGSILVNKEGKRFFNELETRDKVSKAILEQPDKTSFIIFDENIRNNKKVTVDKYIAQGIVVEAPTVAELATKLGMDPKTLEDTMAKWAKVVETNKDEEFGRTTAIKGALNEGPFYAIAVSPGVHHTMGGVTIDTTAQVLNEKNEPIKGLYAAGEVVGGIHGGNRIGGSAITDIVVFGRISADSIESYINNSK